MFRINNPDEQVNLLSKENSWTDYKAKRIKQGWPGYIHDVIFPAIDQEKFRVLYSDNNASCPNTGVNILVCLLIIKKITGSTDEELIDMFLCDERVQYALHTLDNDRQPISKNMLNIFRRRLTDYYKTTGIDLLDEEMRRINNLLLEINKVDRNIERMDSLMISSSCKRMSRIELIYTINFNFIKVLSSCSKVPDDFKCYLEKEHKNDVIYRTREKQEESKLSSLLNDSLTLFDKFKDDNEVNNTKEFELLKRVIDEQYDSKNNKPKEGKDIKPTSLQNPADPEATYRTKYGANQGYVANIVEAINNGKPMITDWEVATNVTGDTTLLDNYLNKQQEENNGVKTEIVDGGFYSDKLDEKANEMGIELHPTELVGKKPKETNISKFTIDEENHQVLKCPNNKEPIVSKYNEEKETITAKFDKSCCENCPMREKCCISFKPKKTNTLRATNQQIKSDKIRISRLSEEYQQISNMRAGIEGAPSLLRRRYNIDDRPVKGLFRLKLDLSTSVIAINIKRSYIRVQLIDKIYTFIKKINLFLSKSTNYIFKIIKFEY